MEILSTDLESSTFGKKSNWVLHPETGVRIKHIPTGFAVRCNAFKSQHKNKHIASSYLESYLKGCSNENKLQ